MKARGPQSRWWSYSFVTLLVALWATSCSHKAPPPAQQAGPALAARADAPPPKPPAAAPAETDEPVRARDPASIYFDFDSALLRDDARATLGKVASGLANEADGRASSPRLDIEGNCDEVGTVEYNLALGQQRADAAKQYLIRLGIEPTRIHTASFGSQRPRYPGHDDVAHAKNRRDDLLYR
jgi:peptidoglycan-associated lipoprotein